MVAATLTWTARGGRVWTAGESAVPGARWAYELICVGGGYEVTRCADGTTKFVHSLAAGRQQAEDWERVR